MKKLALALVLAFLLIPVKFISLRTTGRPGP